MFAGKKLMVKRVGIKWFPDLDNVVAIATVGGRGPTGEYGVVCRQCKRSKRRPLPVRRRGVAEKLLNPPLTGRVLGFGRSEFGWWGGR